MIFHTIADAKKALNRIRKENGSKRVHYPVLFKKSLMVLRKKLDLGVDALCEELELNHSTVWNWRKQFEEGLYQMDAAYAVSKKSKKINHAILSDLKQKVVDMQEKIAFIEKAESMGFKISEA